MSPSETNDTIPLAPLVASDWGEAARFLEQAVRAGCHDPQAHYLLAMCYKRLGRTVEARTQLGKIKEADANILLQLGLLAFQQGDYGQAEQDFARSFELEPAYPAGYNLTLTLLCLGNHAACAQQIGQILPRAPTAEDQRRLSLLHALLTAQPSGASTSNGSVPRSDKSADGAAKDPFGDAGAFWAALSTEEERQLVHFLCGLGRFDAAFPLLQKLALLRPHSPLAREAHLEAVLVQAKGLIDRCRWREARDLLVNQTRLPAVPTGAGVLVPASHVALLNVLGVCSCMLQDFERAAWYFSTALKLVGKDSWLEQNLALAYEWHGMLEHADPHWSRYFDLIELGAPAPNHAHYRSKLAYECLHRLADLYSKKEKWTAALAYLQKAQRLRPADSETLDRLFHLYIQLKRSDEAARTLKRLREVRPRDALLDLYQLDLHDAGSFEEIEQLFTAIRRILEKNTGELRVEERGLAMIVNLIPLLERKADQAGTQLTRVVEQMRRLPSYQINWPAVRDVMRELEDKFVRLRRLSNKMLPLMAGEECRRRLKDLIAQTDRKIDQCHALAE